MITLIRPSAPYFPSYREAYAEYQAHGVRSYAFQSAAEADLLQYFDDYRQARNLRPGYVGCDFYWLVDDKQALFIGQIAIRHQLTEALLRYGGNIGYGVRYSHWNQGCGTQMLRLALDKARERGIDRALITCDDTNFASARVAEKNGFVLTDKIENVIEGQPVLTRRYWQTL